MTKMYKTYQAAQADLGAAFAGLYVVLKYGVRTRSEHHGSHRHGKWYCHTGYVPGAELGQGERVHYELFQIGKRGGLKRLKRVCKEIPEEFPVYDQAHPDRFTAIVQFSIDEYDIDNAFLDAIVDSPPQGDWEDVEPIAHQHRWW